MYKAKQELINDMVVGCEGFSSQKKYFTGGESIMQFPVTVSFESEGEYTVIIRDGMLKVEKKS